MVYDSHDSEPRSQESEYSICPPTGLLAANADIFAIFDHRTQDSGNISFGVEIDGERYFVKITGGFADTCMRERFGLC